MKKNILLLLLFLNYLLPQTTKAFEIPFESITVYEAQKLAQVSNKLIFIDAYTTWCGPCKWMSKNVFTNEEVARFYGENFISIKMDMEKDLGPEFALKYDIHSYPTFVFLDATGQKIHQTCGSKEASQFIEDGRNALNPQNQLITYQNNYLEGNRDFNFLKSYASILENANIDATEVILQLVNSDSNKELINAQDFDLLSNYCEADGPTFEFIMKNYDQYQQLVEKKKLEDFCSSVFLKAAVKAGKANSSDQLSSAKTTLTKYNLTQSNELLLHMDWKYAQVTKKNMLEAAQPFIEGYKMTDANELNNAAWSLFENTKDSKSLLTASEWSRLSVELEKNFANTDTYANILHKEGKEKEAMEMSNLSLELAIEEEQESQDAKKLNADIKAALETK